MHGLWPLCHRLGGEFHVTTAPRQGTVITVTVPVPAPVPAREAVHD